MFQDHPRAFPYHLENFRTMMRTKSSRKEVEAWGHFITGLLIANVKFPDELPMWAMELINSPRHYATACQHNPSAARLYERHHDFSPFWWVEGTKRFRLYVGAEVTLHNPNDDRVVFYEVTSFSEEFTHVNLQGRQMGLRLRLRLSHQQVAAITASRARR